MILMESIQGLLTPWFISIMAVYTDLSYTTRGCKNKELNSYKEGISNRIVSSKPNSTKENLTKMEKRKW